MLFECKVRNSGHLPIVGNHVYVKIEFFAYFLVEKYRKWKFRQDAICVQSLKFISSVEIAPTKTSPTQTPSHPIWRRDSTALTDIEGIAHATVLCSKTGAFEHTHGGNFLRSQPIFKILSPLEREGNFQIKWLIISYHTLSMLQIWTLQQTYQFYTFID